MNVSLHPIPPGTSAVAFLWEPLPLGKTVRGNWNNIKSRLLEWKKENVNKKKPHNILLKNRGTTELSFSPEKNLKYKSVNT